MICGSQLLIMIEHRFPFRSTAGFPAMSIPWLLHKKLIGPVTESLGAFRVRNSRKRRRVSIRPRILAGCGEAQ